ncbi:SART-1 protein [Fistulina hepatica ATCC 64428]|nr:SART-1 protein [Fistulina hepatica ATCC 64428]
MSMEESISLEETNKIRISLGLKPLTDDKAPADDKEKVAEENYAKQRDREAKDRETKKVREHIAKVRNRRELRASLKGATLGDADGDEDTLKWIKRSKKKEKELARKRQAELENQDKLFQEEYTERDLEGLKVNHDLDAMDEGEDHILTLKDSRILDNEEDELQDIELAESERTKKINELKTKRRDYTGYDDDEFVEGNQGLKRAVLSKYDEEINGSSETGFRLGSSTVSAKAKAKAKVEETAAAVNKSLLTIDYAKNIGASDYLQEGDIGFKKPRTKKKRSSRRATVLDDEPTDQMDVDQKPAPLIRDLNANFVDDDELQAALARSRQAKLHGRKAKKLSPEQLAQKIVQQRSQEEEDAQRAMSMDNVDGVADGEDDGLTFDDTSEFVRTVGINPIQPPKAKKEVKESVSPLKREGSTAPGDVAIEEMEVGEVPVTEEEEDADAAMAMAMLDDIEQALKAAEQESDADVGTSAEQTFGSMASTLTILRQTGMVSAPNAEQVEREKTQLQQNLWLSEQRRRVAQREMERLASRGGNKDQAQREYENRMREQQEARDQLEAFKHYKPDVNIVYYDEHGRTLTPKEAWKALSHKFHGKGSGKMKTEKVLKRIAEEKKQAAMASGDTPLSMSRAFQQRQEKTGEAYFVLSVGNRGAVPQAAEYFDAQPLSKGKTEKGKKKKEAAAAKAAHRDGEQSFMTLPAPIASPVPKPGFSRISSAADTPNASSTPTGERSKVHFGFKRKATGEPEDSPAPKRR